MIALAISLSASLRAELGCMDNSYHLTQRYDAKEYHYVQCNCDCSKERQFPQRAQCSQCLHYHTPVTTIVMPLSTALNTHAQSTTPLYDPNLALQRTVFGQVDADK
jgi:hypothetical protein